MEVPTGIRHGRGDIRLSPPSLMALCRSLCTSYGPILSVLLLLLWIPTFTLADPAAPASPASPEDQIWATFQYDFPAQTIAQFQALADEAGKRGDADAQAIYLSQMARAEGVRKNLDAADAILDRAEKLAKGDGARERIKLERARILRRRGRTKAAREAFVGVYDTARKLGLHPNLPIDAAHMLALMSEGNEAKQWTERGFTLAESSENPLVNRWVGVLAWNLAGSYEEQGNHAMAALYYSRSLASRVTHSNAAVLRTTEHALARQLRFLGACRETIGIETRLLSQEPEKDAAPQLYEIAECRSSLGEKQEASAFAARALKVLGKGDAPPEIMERLRSMVH